MHYSCQTDEQRRMLPLLYRMSGVKRRFSILLSGPEGTAHRHDVFPAPTGPADMGPGMGYRMALYERESSPLALRASHQALEESGVPPAEITHLITVSCSGFVAPGVDITLMKRLGLPRTVQRTHVGFMGCHGALNGLRVARAFADCDPGARILLCAVELCSIHYRYGWEPDHIVANALFADGSAAVVAAAQDGADDAAWCVSATGSCLIPDSEDAMTWRLADNGFVMSLSARVPALIGSHLRGWLEGWLAQSGLSLPDVRTWAVHPGGPRILTAVVDVLGLEKDAVKVSREVLRDYGNMSSPTILFILERLRRENAPRPCVALGFGPGLMAEALLFT
jgi:prepilin-type processing-associated H-X9-DG protein